MKTRIYCSFLALASLLCVLGVSPAIAAPRVSSVLILPDGAEGVDLLLANAADALRQLNVGVTEFDDAELAGFDLAAALECLNDAKAEDCSDSVNMVPAEWLLLLRIRRESDSPDADQTVVAKYYSAKTGDLLQVEQRICQRCSSAERLAEIIRTLVDEMSTAQLAAKAPDTFLDIQSNPPGATLSIDGTAVGPTGQSYRVKPGDHELVIRQQGYRTATQNVSVAANEHKALTVSLDKLPPPDVWQRRIGWGAIGVGVAALSLGGYYIAVDDGDRQPGEPFEATRNDSATTGKVLMGVGIGVALGVAFALLTSDSPDDTSGFSFLAAPVEDGLAVGLGGRF